METIINNLKIHYIQEGSGKDILLLHGWGGRWESWYPIFQHLKQKYRVTALDLPGFGNSEMLPKPAGLLFFTEVIAAFIKKLALRKPVVIGHSFGGSIAASLAINYPDLIEKVILANASGIRNKDFKKVIFSAMAKAGNLFFSFPGFEIYKDKIRKLFYKYLGVNDYLTSGKMKESFKIIVSEDLTPVLSKITLPALLVWGEKDNSTPLWQGILFNKLIPGSKLVVIPHCGHFAYLENPEMFCGEVEKFIDTDSR